MEPIPDPLKAVQNAWYKMLVDFRAWYMPETQQTAEWKQRLIGRAIKSCQGRMMDDSETMLAEYRKAQNAQVAGGATAFMPIMLTATAVIDQPPDVSQLKTVSYFVDVAIAGKPVKMRLVANTVRAQIAFFATNPHDARSVCAQICAYVDDDVKRRIQVQFDVGGGVMLPSTFTILENQLFPTPVPSEAINLSVFTVDVQLVGHVPHVLGLGGQFDNTVGNGFNPDGSAIDKPPIDDRVVVQADAFDVGHTRILADPETGDVTVESIND